MYLHLERAAISQGLEMWPSPVTMLKVELNAVSDSDYRYKDKMFGYMYRKVASDESS